MKMQAANESNLKNMKEAFGRLLNLALLKCTFLPWAWDIADFEAALLHYIGRFFGENIF